MNIPAVVALYLLVQMLLVQSAAKSLENCILDIFQKYQCKNVLYITQSNTYELDNLLKILHPHWLYLNFYNVYRRPPNVKIDIAVLLVENSIRVDIALNSIKNFLFKSEAIFIFINLEKLGHKMLLFLAFRYGFRNAFVVQKHDLKVFGYLPVLNGYCSDVETTSLGVCSNVNYQMYDINVDMSNCTIPIGAVISEPYFDKNNEGFEAAILGIVTDRLGLHVEYTMHYIGIVVKMLEEMKLDLVAGEMMPAGDASKILVYYGENEMALFVPKARTLPPWKNLIHIYDLATWICLLASVIAFTIFWHIAQHQNHTFYIVCSLISTLPKTPTTFKPLFALWMIFVLILTNAFSGLLISFMFKPLYDQQMSSLDDLIAQNWLIYDSTLYPDFLNFTNLDTLRNRHVWCFDDTLKCYHQLSNDKTAFASTVRSFNNIKKSRGNVEVHKFNSLKLYLVFLTCDRSKYKAKIKHVLDRMFEVGLVQHLDTYNSDPPKKILDKQYRPVALKHLYLIIGWYFVGVFGAVLAFFKNYVIVKVKGSIL